MNLKKTRKLILDAAENSINELIKVMNKRMDPKEIDPEKVKISASAYRLAMEDAMAMMERVGELQAMLEDAPKDKKEQESFFGVENRVK